MQLLIKPYYYSSDIRGVHRLKLSPFQKQFYAKLYRLRIVEQKRFVVGGAKYTEDLKRFHQLQDEYLLLVNNDIKDIVELVNFKIEMQQKMQQIDDRQQDIYKDNSSRKRKIKTDEQYREYQMWHVEIQGELDKLKQEKREIKKQLQLVEGIMKENLYTAYYEVSENDEIVGDREIEIPKVEKDTVVEDAVAVEPDANVAVMNPINGQNDRVEQNQDDDIEEKQIDLYGAGMLDVFNVPDVDVVRTGERITDVTGKSECMEVKESESMDKVAWIVSRISENGGYENISVSVKADIFDFDIVDVSGNIKLFSDVMKRLGIKLDRTELYEEFQRVYDESVSGETDKEREEDKMWNRGRGR